MNAMGFSRSDAFSDKAERMSGEFGRCSVVVLFQCGVCASSLNLTVLLVFQCEVWPKGQLLSGLRLSGKNPPCVAVSVVIGKRNIGILSKGKGFNGSCSCFTVAGSITWGCVRSLSEPSMMRRIGGGGRRRAISKTCLMETTRSRTMKCIR